MGKKLFHIIMVLIASAFLIIILINQPQPIGFFIAFLLIIFVALVIYIQSIDFIEEKSTKKVPLRNKEIKNHH